VAGRPLPQNTHGEAQLESVDSTDNPKRRWRSGVHRAPRSPLLIVHRADEVTGPSVSSARGMPADLPCTGSAGAFHLTNRLFSGECRWLTSSIMVQKKARRFAGGAKVGRAKDWAQLSSDGVPKLICDRCTQCHKRYRNDAGHIIAASCLSAAMPTVPQMPAEVRDGQRWRARLARSIDFGCEDPRREPG
jgi:hypothetical protein